MNVDFISNFLHLIFFLPFSVIVIFTCMCWMYWKYVKHANVKMRKSEWERERGACIFYLFLYYIVSMLRTIVEERCYYFLCAEHALLRKKFLKHFHKYVEWSREKSLFFNVRMLNFMRPIRYYNILSLICSLWWTWLSALFASVFENEHTKRSQVDKKTFQSPHKLCSLFISLSTSYLTLYEHELFSILTNVSWHATWIFFC